MLGLFKTKKKTTQVKILVVDDEPDLVSTVEYRLKFANCSVVTASTARKVWSVRPPRNPTSFYSTRTCR